MQGIIIDLKYYPFYIKRHFLFCELRRNCIPVILPYVLWSHYLNVIAFVPFNYDIFDRESCKWNIRKEKHNNDCSKLTKKKYIGIIERGI